MRENLEGGRGKEAVTEEEWIKHIGSFHKVPAKPQLLLILRSTEDVDDNKYYLEQYNSCDENI